MKNKKYIKSMDQLNPDKITKERMLSQIMERKERKSPWPGMGMGKTLVSVALLAVVLVVMVSLGNKAGSKIIYQGEGLKITAMGNAPKVEGDPSSITAIYTEDEVFTLFPIIAFKGKVLSLQNITMEDELGKTYASYANIQVLESYQGDLKKGDEVKILLPGPVENGKIMGSDYNITRAFQGGEEGIFLPVVNDDPTSALYNFTKYSLYDTTRFAFIMTKEGLDFNKDTFLGLKDAKTLEDVQQYISRKLK